MIFLFGNIETPAGRIRLTQSVCPNCNRRGALEAVFFCAYAHLFWIPLMASGKRTEVYCQYCGEISKNNLSEDIRKQLKRHQKELPQPLWHFSGLFLLIAGTLILIFLHFQDNKRDWQSLVSPTQGDIYEYRTESGWFSNYKVIDVSENEVTVHQNVRETQMKSALNTLGSDYLDEPGEEIIFDKNELQEMYKEKIIFEVIR